MTAFTVTPGSFPFRHTGNFQKKANTKILMADRGMTAFVYKHRRLLESNTYSGNSKFVSHSDDFRQAA